MTHFTLAACAVLALSTGQDKPSTNTTTLARGNTALAFDLYHQLHKRTGNLFFSPYSISTALGMTYAGARGDTATEMARTLHFDLSPEQISPAFGELIRQTNAAPGAERKFQLVTANALWAQKGYRFLPPYLEQVKGNYQATLQELDFMNAPEPARRTINQWVEKQTNDKIKELLVPGVVKEDTRLVLTNAIYFKGEWASQFKKGQTQPADFFLSADRPMRVSMMRQVGRYALHDGKDVQVLEMFYQGYEVSMLIILPRKVEGLGDLEKDLKPAKFAEWTSAMKVRRVDVNLPKFKVTGQMSLGELLRDMGMPLAFTDAADFSGMTGKKDLLISKVIHKAYVDVNEEGTEAAAATGVIMAPTSAPPVEEEPVLFRADHPFVYAIRHRATGSILFLGRLSQP